MIKIWARTLIAMIGIVAGLGTGWGQQPESAPAKINYEKMGEALLNAILKGNFDEYRVLLTAPAAQTLSPEAVKRLGAELGARFGKLSSIQIGEHQQTGMFHRVLYDCTFTKGKTLMVVVTENDEKIASILFPEVPLAKEPEARLAKPSPPESPPPGPISPTSPPPTAPARSWPESKSDVHLPFTGKWKVANGGREASQNGHAASRAERYSYDFIMVGIDDRAFRTDGKRNEDYYAFEREVKAPADGVISQVIDGIEDNVPGETNPYFPLGNVVIIDHKNGEYSVLAHLAKGSIRVKERQRVKQGDTVALCGNSGDSPHPHIHYHLQDQPRLAQASGLPITFHQYYSGNKPVEKGVPEFNEFVAN